MLPFSPAWKAVLLQFNPFWHWPDSQLVPFIHPFIHLVTSLPFIKRRWHFWHSLCTFTCLPVRFHVPFSHHRQHHPESWLLLCLNDNISPEFNRNRAHPFIPLFPSFSLRTHLSLFAPPRLVVQSVWPLHGFSMWPCVSSLLCLLLLLRTAPATAHISALLSDVLVRRMAAAALPSDFTSGVPLFVTVYSPEYSGQPLWDFLVDFSGSHQFLCNNFFLYISDISLRKCSSCSLHCDPVIVIKVNRQHCVS